MPRIPAETSIAIINRQIKKPAFFAILGKKEATVGMIAQKRNSSFITTKQYKENKNKV